MASQNVKKLPSRKSKSKKKSFLKKLEDCKNTTNPFEELRTLCRTYFHNKTIPELDRAYYLSELYKFCKALPNYLEFFCSVIDSPPIKELIYTTYIHRGTKVIMEISKELSQGKGEKLQLLKALGIFCFSSQFPNYNADHYVLAAVVHFFSLSSPYCRFALNCAANILVKSSRIAKDAKSPLTHLLQEISSTVYINVDYLKICSTLLRALNSVLTSVALEDPEEIQSVLKLIYKLTFLGTSFMPRVDTNENSASDASDNDTPYAKDDFYYGKIKFYGLNCVQTLFKKYSKALFGLWTVVFGKSEESPASLLYLLNQEKSQKTRVCVCGVITSILENSPLGKWQGSQQEASLGNKELAEKLPEIIKSLHKGLANSLHTENNSAILSSLLKTTSSLIENTPYEHFEGEYLKSLGRSVICLWENLEVRNGVLATLNSVLKVGHPQLQQLISEQMIDWVFLPENVMIEKLSLLGKMIRGYPDKMEKHYQKIETSLTKCIEQGESKLQAKAFEVIEEYIRVKPNSCIINLVIEKLMVFIDQLQLESIAHALNTLSLFSDFGFISDSQLNTLLDFLVKFEDLQTKFPPLICAVLKIIGVLAKAHKIKEEFFETFLKIITTSRKMTNLNIAINSSLAVSYLCRNPVAKNHLDFLFSIIEEDSNNRKEKVISNAIIAVGNIFETFEFGVFSHLHEELLNICVKGLPHKNAKVGWDASSSLYKMFCNSSIPMKEHLVPFLLSTISNHSNFKTRISACQLLRFYKTNLASFTEVFEILAKSIAFEMQPFSADGTVLKYHSLFRKEALLTALHFIYYTQRPSQGVMENLSYYLGCLFDKFEDLELQKVDWVNQALRKVVNWIHTYDEFKVSFGLLEDLRTLSGIA